jgi:hypothetical protein
VRPAQEQGIAHEQSLVSRPPRVDHYAVVRKIQRDFIAISAASLLAYDAPVLEFLYLSGIVAKVPDKNLLVMLAEERRRQIERDREIRKAQREAGQFEITQRSIVDLAHGSPLAQMRMLHGLGDCQYRRHRHTARASRS